MANIVNGGPLVTNRTPVAWRGSMEAISINSARGKILLLQLANDSDNLSLNLHILRVGVNRLHLAAGRLKANAT